MFNVINSVNSVKSVFIKTVCVPQDAPYFVKSSNAGAQRITQNYVKYTIFVELLGSDSLRKEDIMNI